jgi:hypothetical protein
MITASMTGFFILVPPWYYVVSLLIVRIQLSMRPLQTV